MNTVEPPLPPNWSCVWYNLTITQFKLDKSTRREHKGHCVIYQLACNSYHLAAS